MIRLFKRLEEWRPKIERAMLARLHGVTDSPAAKDPAYAGGLRSAVSASLDQAIACIERGEGPPAPVPPELLAQVRRAARHGEPLDTVLRRCLASGLLFNDFLIEAAREEALLPGKELPEALRAASALLERLLAAVGREHRLEAELRLHSTERRRADRVRRLLAGEPLDSAELRYGLDTWHLGAIASGSGAEEATREIALALDRRLLLVRADEETLWVWFGGRRKITAAEVIRRASALWPEGAFLALGEPGRGIDAWRLSHHQAQAAMSVARRGPWTMVRYDDVSLLASMLQDETLTRSLRDLYLSPLAGERDGGEALRQTLRAYFTAERNASSAAAALGISRKTVANRLRAIEERLDRPIASCAAEMEAALRLDQLGGGAPDRRPSTGLGAR